MGLEHGLFINDVTQAHTFVNRKSDVIEGQWVRKSPNVHDVIKGWSPNIIKLPEPVISVALIWNQHPGAHRKRSANNLKTQSYITFRKETLTLCWSKYRPNRSYFYIQINWNNRSNLVLAKMWTRPGFEVWIGAFDQNSGVEKVL